MYGSGQKKCIPLCMIYQKAMLTKQKAALYRNIGINKLEEMLKVPNCPFVLYAEKKKLTNQRGFEEYLPKQIKRFDFTFPPFYAMIKFEFCGSFIKKSTRLRML